MVLGGGRGGGGKGRGRGERKGEEEGWEEGGRRKRGGGRRGVRKHPKLKTPTPPALLLVWSDVLKRPRELVASSFGFQVWGLRVWGVVGGFGLLAAAIYRL